MGVVLVNDKLETPIKEIIEKAVLKRFRQIDKVERIEAWCGALSLK